MTISSTNRKAGPFIGNGSASVFAFSFRVFAASDLEVVRITVATGVETTLTINSNYTVSLNADQNSNPGGSITLTGGALASGYNLIITSDIANLQPTDLTNQGGFYPEVITGALDRATIQIQQLHEHVARTLSYPITDPTVGTELPPLEQRKGTVLAFDETTGAPEAGPSVGAILTVSGNIAGINTVASNINSVNTVSSNIVAVQNANANATVAANSATAAAASATAAANSATSASNSAVSALAARNDAVSAAGASGNIEFYNTKSDADAALSSLANLQIVEIFADESRSGRRTRYRKESGSYVFKIYLDPTRLTADACAVAPLTLSGVQTVDGVSGIAGATKVLVSQQTNPATNGIYLMQSGGWTRHVDFDAAFEAENSSILITGGNTQKGRLYKMVTVGPVTLGTTPLLFWNNEGGGGGSGSLIETARKSRGVYVIVGNSNTVGRVGNHIAYLRGRGHPERGPWRNWTKYAMADSGFKLSALVSAIATGTQNAEPADFTPAVTPTFASSPYFGNPWMIINGLKKHPNAILEICLGINDFGLGAASRAPGGSGDPAVYRANLERFIGFVLSQTTAHILLRIEQPFSGDADFVVGSTNTTEWASDSPDGTIATGARTASEKMIACHRDWIGRHPRVSVFDAPKEVYGADFCNDPAVECLDNQVGATFIGTAIASGTRELIDDTLHASDLGKRREEEAIMRMLFGARSNFTDYLIVGPNFDFSTVVKGHWFHFESISDSGSNTLFRVRASREYLMWQNTLNELLGAAGKIPTLDALAEAERALLLGDPSAIQDILGFRNQIKFYFPVTGNIYTATDITLSNVVTDAARFNEKYYIFNVLGVNMSTEATAAIGGAVGYPAQPATSVWKQRCFIYIDKIENLAHTPRIISFGVYPTLGGADNPFNPVGTDPTWQLRRFRCVRHSNSPTTPTISLRVHNITDGRFVEGSVNFPTSAGMEVGSWSFASGVLTGTWTANATNIDAAIAATIWPASTNGQVTMKAGYYLSGLASGTLSEPAQVTVVST